MKFLQLHDPLLSLLFENEDIVAVDKPDGIDSHTNDSKKGNEGFVVPGLIEIFEAQLGCKLHIIHRLDRTTTGVIVFGKSLESAKKYQLYFRNRETKKTYLFVTASRSEKAEFETKQPILHKGVELAATTSFRRLSRTEKFELWAAHPHTGRNHQIRIHGAHVGLPLLGDAKYGGAKFPFIALHNLRIEFPNGVVIESRAPLCFDDLRVLEDQDFARMFHEVDRRQRLFGSRLEDQCCRLAHTSSQDQRAFALDQFGPVLQISWYKDSWTPTNERAAARVAEVLEKPMLIRLLSAKFREKSGQPRLVTVGGEGPLSWTAREGERQNDLRADAGLSVGLFVDQRLQRDWVQKNAAGKSVLNLFSYTGGYSIAAALGGAASVVSVDTSKAALNWSRRNFELNRLNPENFAFLNRDALQYLDQCHTKNQKFDLVICDTPSFSRGEKTIFKLEKDLAPFLGKVLRVLSDRGVILFATNLESFFADDLRRALDAVRAASPVEITSLQSALDFELPGEKTGLKSFLISR